MNDLLFHAAPAAVRRLSQRLTELLDLIAEYLTDMRLMKNIVNEYEFFSVQLLTTRPGITPDHV